METRAYSWTDQYQRSWDVIQEDSKGSISLANADQISTDFAEMIALRRKWLERSSGCQRGILRHIFVVVDLSLSMGAKDFKPTYLEITCSHLKKFITEFYDQNPISLLGLIVTKDGVAQKVSELSGNPLIHHQAIDAFNNMSMIKGEPSLANSLELAMVSLNHVPSHGSKEILVLMASLTSRDPVDISGVADKLKEADISVNIIGLSAELHVCKKLSQETNGRYSVALHEDHYKTLLWDVIPPPVSFDVGPAAFVPMGFPALVNEKSLSSSNGEIRPEGYICPRCKSKLSDLPTDCPVCKLKLVSAPHLARSYHHLFPILPFNEVAVEETSTRFCSACPNKLSQRTLSIDNRLPKARQGQGAKLKIPSSPVQVVVDYTSRSQEMSVTHIVGYQCRKCAKIFCLSCDIFIHDTLHTCPGCVS